MKKQFIFLTLAILLALGKTAAQTYVPVAATGYTLDGVAENTTAISTTGAAMDNSDFVLYSQFYGTMYSGGPVGLPNNGTIVNGARTYQLQSYTSPNVLHVQAGLKDSLTFVTPQAFPAISLLSFATQGYAVINVTVRFTDNTTQVFSGLNLDDWFTANPSVYNGFDRVLRTTGVPALVGSAGNPRMFGTDLSILCANQGKLIKRVVVQNTSGTAHVCVMAISGSVPAYSATASASLLCSGASATLSGTGLATYTWMPVGSFAGSNSATVSVSPTTTTTYTLTGDNGGCPGTAVVTINVSGGLPVLSLTGSSQSVCLGAAATITASGALNYTLSSPAANGATFAPSATAVYTVTGANGCGSSSVTTSISVLPLPVTGIASNSLVCAGMPATLTAGGATNYTWMPGANSNTSYIVSPAANTTYTITGKTGNCTGTAVVTINTKPNPTLSISASNTMICAGDAVSLTVSGNAVTYSWSPGGQSGTTITDSPVNLILYSVTGTNSVNCVSSTQQVVIVNPLPVVNASASNFLVCAGGASTLSASGASTYVWANGTSSTAQTMVVNPVTDATYSVTGTSSLSCASSTFVTVSVYSPTISVSSATSICTGNFVMLGAGVADSYTWSGGQSSQNITISPSLTTVYTISASVNNLNGLSCLASNAVTVTVHQNPVITASASSTIICRGNTAILTGAGAGNGGTYTWTGGAGAVSNATTGVSPIADQSYTVAGIDANGCKGAAIITLKVSNCTGIAVNGAGMAGISVYPNPASGAVHIRSEAAVALVIVDGLGQPVRNIILEHTNAYYVSVEGLAPGIYFVMDANNRAGGGQKIIIAE